MRRATTSLLIAAALAAGCDRPGPLTQRMVLSAETVVMEVGGDDPPAYTLWAMGTEEWDSEHAYQLTATVEWGAEWLVAEVAPFSRDPYEIRLAARPTAFTTPGNYAASVAIRAPDVESRWVTVYLYVPAPGLEASTRNVRFLMAPGGPAPAARTVVVTPQGAPSGIVPPPPGVRFAFHPGACGEWMDAAVTTLGAEPAVTLAPVGAALAGLPAGTACRVDVTVDLDFEAYPGMTWRSSATIQAVLDVQATPEPELVEVSRTRLEFRGLAGRDVPAQAVTVRDALGGDLTRPAISASASWISATLSATKPYVLTILPRSWMLPAGTHTGTVTIGTPGSAAPDVVSVRFESEAWGYYGFSLMAMGLSADEVMDGRFLVAGGRSFGSSDPGYQVCDLRPCSDAVYGVGRMLTPRARHTTTQYARGHVIAAGGVAPGSGAPVGTFELYDWSHGHGWYVERPLVTPRFLHTATLLEDGRVLLAGGAIGSEGDPVALSDAELLDPGAPDSGASGSFQPAWAAHSVRVGSMVTPRRDASAVLLPSGKVLVAGGQRVEGAALASAELFDPASGTWSLTGAMNEARSAAALVLLADGRVLAAGGTDGQRALATAELYDPDTETWTYTTSMALGRVAPAVRLPSGRVLLVAGLTGELGARVVTATVERYDPATQSWEPAGSLREPRVGHAVAQRYDGLVLVAGGSRALPWADHTLVGTVELGSGEAP